MDSIFGWNVSPRASMNIFFFLHIYHQINILLVKQNKSEQHFVNTSNINDWIISYE